MSNQTIYLPNYTVGADAYDKIALYQRPPMARRPWLWVAKLPCPKRGKALSDSVEHTAITLLGFLWYGGNATMENVQRLQADPLVQQADMLFAVGGGRACDTVKVLGALLDKPVFTFPTLASNCAACTSLSVMYHEDGSFKDYAYQNHPPLHTFINTQIIAESPVSLFWAGIGDALSKEYEVAYCCRDKQLSHLPQLGLGVAKTCTAPLLKHAKKALADCRSHRVSAELEEVVLDIIMLTGIVSNCTVHISDHIAPGRPVLLQQFTGALCVLRQFLDPGM
ncbi:MAG: iron-containing alcohol dehydrogenase [Shewanella fodinae]|nr:iron-containing alcohol dehydrogenase [Shewanella fodinae]